MSCCSVGRYNWYLMGNDGALKIFLEDIDDILLTDEPEEDTHDEQLSRLRIAIGWLKNIEP